jgi:metal-responsive CopG/Arc/MetJ family transcriptional regulator
MKTAISLPEPLFQAAERLAKQMGLSRSLLFQRALQTYLREHQDAGVTEALNSVYDQEMEGAGLDPLLEDWQLNSVPQDDWS